MNIIQAGTIQGSQIQQGSPGARQTVHAPADVQASLQVLVQRLGDLTEVLGYSREQTEALNTLREATQAELGAQKPDKGRLASLWEGFRRFFTAYGYGKATGEIWTFLTGLFPGGGAA